MRVMHVIAGAWSRRTCVTRCVTVAGRVTTRRIVVSFLVVFKKVIILVFATLLMRSSAASSTSITISFCSRFERYSAAEFEIEFIVVLKGV